MAKAPKKTRSVKVEGGYILDPRDKPRHRGRCGLPKEPEPTEQVNGVHRNGVPEGEK